MVEYQSLVLLAVLCELVLMAFIFCIARFYEMKFRERTYPASFLFPSIVFLLMMAFVLYAGSGLGLELLITNACTLLVLATAGWLLYRKMMGVSR